ncbi:hypothetical protein SNK04_014045 [Fusarium graminearum]
MSAFWPAHHGQVQGAPGASAEGNAGASVLLEYRNAEGVVVLPVEGNRVMSASKNRVYDSNVVGTAPAGAATVNIAGNGIRFRENKILFVDDFEWDHTVAAVGLDHEAVFRITLQVSDSAGRSAIWSGVIGDRSTYFTSRPYGITAPSRGCWRQRRSPAPACSSGPMQTASAWRAQCLCSLPERCEPPAPGELGGTTQRAGASVRGRNAAQRSPALQHR